MTRGRWQQTFAALIFAALIFAGILTACASGTTQTDAGQPEDVVRPASTSSAELELTETEVTGARVFVRRWLSEFHRAQNTGRTDVFTRMSRACTNCRRLADTVDEIYAAGGFISTNGWQALRMQFHRLPTDQVEVTLDVKAERVRYAAAAGGEVHSYTLEPKKHLMIVRPQQRGWVVTFVGVNWI